MSETSNGKVVLVVAEPELARTLERQWEQGRTPNVWDFLQRAGDLSPRQRAAVLLIDQRERWQRGEPVLVEEYLSREPSLRSEAAAVVDLAYGEFLQRCDRGERPSPQEYLDRFPTHRERLNRLFALDRVLTDDGLLWEEEEDASRAQDRAVGGEGRALPGGQAPGAPNEPKRRISVALARRHGPQLAVDIRPLLRTRLKIIALITSAAFAAYLLAGLYLRLSEVQIRGGLVIDLPHHAVVLVILVVFAWILWRDRSLGIASLRAIELTMFGLVAGVFGLIQWSALLDGQSNWDVYYSGYVSLRWFALLVVYGTVVPNTWVRCTVCVAAIALCPLMVAVAAQHWNGAVDDQLLVPFFLEMSLWLAVGTAFATYFCYRIEWLYQRAVEARALGQYRVIRHLGEGGMGTVYLAEHVLLKRECAVKLIRQDWAGNDMRQRRFEREVRATATLTHPNTVQVYDYGHTEDGTFYYVMEYLPGLTLDELVERYGPLSAARAIYFLQQICGALREAHAIPLIHRDIKPSNVMVCTRGGLHDVAKLLDFGLVLAQGVGPDGEPLTEAGLLVGSPDYMSPEQAGGQQDLDARSDIYSVGALAYFLLVGRPPFTGLPTSGVLAAHLKETPTPLTTLRPGVPADLEAVVLGCLAKDPADRFPNAESLELALAECQAAGQWSASEAAAWWRDRVPAR
jgi:serine/threonine-protein kinase